jgi:TIR domain
MNSVQPLPHAYAFDAFISYSHKDKTWVDALVKSLEGHGLRIHIDSEHFEAGLASLDNMAAGIERAQRTVVILTPNWVESPWAQLEGAMSARTDPAGWYGRLVPILRAKCEPPAWLSMRSWWDFIDDDRASNQIAKLARLLRRPLGFNLVRSERLQTGMKTLSNLVRGPLYETMLKYRYRFEPIGARTRRLDALKKVHDQLDRVENDCRVHILLALPSFPTNENAVEAIGNHIITLEGVIEQLRKMENDPVFKPGGLDWIKKLERAHEMLVNGCNALDPKPIQVAVQKLGEVLATYPGRIDARMLQAAADLELQAVIDAIRALIQHARDAAVDAADIAKLEDSLGDLEDLDQQIRELVTSHNRWQDVDIDLRRVSNALADGLQQELRDDWPTLKHRITILGASDADASRNLQQAAVAVDRAMDGDNARDLARNYRLYLRRASVRFSAVDTDLNKQCDELVDAGRAIADIVEALHE